MSNRKYMCEIALCPWSFWGISLNINININMNPWYFMNISIEDKEQNFEVALTRIYLLQKCLDFEAGGDLAKNLFRVYEHVRKEIIKTSFNENDTKQLENAISYITLIYEGWSDITKKV